MTRAHVRRAIDYSTFDPLNIDHLVRERMVLEEMYAELAVVAHQAGLQAEVATMMSAVIAKQPEVLRKSAGRVSDLYNGIRSLAMPWVRPHWAGDLHSEAIELVKWESVFGKLDSPEVQEKLKMYEAAGRSPISIGDGGWERLM